MSTTKTCAKTGTAINTQVENFPLHMLPKLFSSYSEFTDPEAIYENNRTSEYERFVNLAFAYSCALGDKNRTRAKQAVDGHVWLDDCIRHSRRRKWIESCEDEAARTMPTPEEVVEFCAEDIIEDEEVRDWISRPGSTIHDWEQYRFGGCGYFEINYDGTSGLPDHDKIFSWDNTWTKFLKVKHDLYYFRPQRMSKVGSLMQLTDTGWLFSAVRFPIQEETTFNWTAVEAMEKDLIVNLFGRNLSLTLEDILLAFGPVPASKKERFGSRGDLYRLAKADPDDLDQPSLISNRQAIMSLIKLGISSPHSSMRSVVSESLLASMEKAFPKTRLEEPLSVSNKNPQLPYCGWRGHATGNKITGMEVPLCDKFRPVATDKGICYSFNHAGIEGVLREGTGFKDVFREVYADEDDEVVDGPLSTEYGRSKGFAVVADSNVLRDYSEVFQSQVNELHLPGWSMPASKSESVGKFTFVPGQFVSSPTMRKGPHLSEVTLDVPRTSIEERERQFLVYHVGITATQTVTHPDIKSMDLGDRKCLFEDEAGEAGLRIFSVYTQDNCQLECKLSIAQDKCGCAPWNYPFFDDDKGGLCSPLGAVCYEDAMSFLSKNLTFEDCGCPKSCNHVQYDFEVTRTETSEFHYETGQPPIANNGSIPSSFLLSGKFKEYFRDPSYNFFDGTVSFFKFDLWKDRNAWAESFSTLNKRHVGDMFGINFYFKVPTVLTIKQKRRFTFADVISAVGGTLGLFMGVSIIGVTEILVEFVSAMNAIVRPVKKETIRP